MESFIWKLMLRVSRKKTVDVFCYRCCYKNVHEHCFFSHCLNFLKFNFISIFSTLFKWISISQFWIMLRDKSLFLKHHVHIQFKFVCTFSSLNIFLFFLWWWPHHLFQIDFFALMLRWEDFFRLLFMIMAYSEEKQVKNWNWFSFFLDSFFKKNFCVLRINFLLRIITWT